MLDEYKQHREADELYFQESYRRTRIQERIIASSASGTPSFDSITTMIGHLANRMVDICLLPSVEAFLAAKTETDDLDEVEEIWAHSWPDIAEEIRLLNQRCESNRHEVRSCC